jgi:hypothetical protein
VVEAWVVVVGARVVVVGPPGAGTAHSGKGRVLGRLE